VPLQPEAIPILSTVCSLAAQAHLTYCERLIDVQALIIVEAVRCLGPKDIQIQQLLLELNTGILCASEATQILVMSKFLC